MNMSFSSKVLIAKSRDLPKKFMIKYIKLLNIGPIKA